MNGVMDEFTVGSGKKESCMVTASTSGQMARLTKGNFAQIKNMAMASTPGLMVDFTKASGETASSTV